MKKLVVLTGAGISAESDIKTFRDSGGLWEGHKVEEVATPEGWLKNPQKVLDFYNERRRQLFEVKPNKAHLELASFESEWEVHVITQNVDDLHERAGSQNILHLHGELLSARSMHDERFKYRWTGDIRLGDLAEDGAQLRPDIVWFGEAVPNMAIAELSCSSADAMLIVGTSLQVYPAAGLVYAMEDSCPIIYLDPNAENSLHGIKSSRHFIIQKSACDGIDEALRMIRSL